MSMKPFNLEEYLANPSRKVIMRNGTPVRIICTDSKFYRPIIALAKKTNGNEKIKYYPENGKCGYMPCDLIFDDDE